jgi:hypothetical protein
MEYRLVENFLLSGFLVLKKCGFVSRKNITQSTRSSTKKNLSALYKLFGQKIIILIAPIKKIIELYMAIYIDIRI